MKKLVVVLLLAGFVGFAVTVVVKRRFYVYASPETESTFFKVFDDNRYDAKASYPQ